jgi:hypothetical protein
MCASRGRATSRLLLALLLLSVPGGCGGRDSGGAGASAATAGSPVGLWTLDRERLLASVDKRFASEGRDVVEHERAQARLVALELLIRGDGKFGLRSTSLGLGQHIVGVWRSEGPVLRFFWQTVDGKPVTKEVQEEATFEDGRIRLPFEELGLDFELVRKE